MIIYMVICLLYFCAWSCFSTDDSRDRAASFNKSVSLDNTSARKRPTTLPTSRSEGNFTLAALGHVGVGGHHHVGGTSKPGSPSTPTVEEESSPESTGIQILPNVSELGIII